jgi:hypothetical protein
MFTANSALNMLMQQHHQHGQLLEQVSPQVTSGVRKHKTPTLIT